MRVSKAEAARESSLEFLAQHHLPRNPSLPLIEQHRELSPPSADAVAARTLVLSHVIGVGYGAERAGLIASLKRLDLWSHASAAEQDLLTKRAPSRQERVNATWLAECVQVLAWGLGLVELDHFSGCDDNLASRFPTPNDEPGAREFIQAATLRPFEELYEQCDLLYCLHWAAVDARLQGHRTLLDESILQERHRAINWLVGVEADWDVVPTDT